MSIFDFDNNENMSASVFDFNDSDADVAEENRYLSDSAAALELISKVLSRYVKNDDGRLIRKIDSIMDYDFMRNFNEIQLSKAADLQLRLNRLSDRLNEEQKYQVLKKRAIVGIGGKFSAGKSKFINSLLDIDAFLPEDQTPTTSIPTFIISGDKETFVAYTQDNRKIALDIDSTQALTHKFHEKYGIGFSAFLDSLVITEPKMKYKNLAFLDTPGYNKDDDSGYNLLKTQITDKEKAYGQLLNVDFLIWLMSVDNGELSASDINFIKELNTDSQILIVLNKADKIPSQDVRQVIDKVKETVKTNNINCYDVVAYSSMEKQEYFDSKSISLFLSEADKKGYSNNDIRRLIKELIEEIGLAIETEISECTEERNKTGSAIIHSGDVFEIRSLVNIHAELNKKLENLKDGLSWYKQKSQELDSLLKELFDDEQ